MSPFPALQHQCMDEVEVDTNGPNPPLATISNAAMQPAIAAFNALPQRS